MWLHCVWLHARGSCPFLAAVSKIKRIPFGPVLDLHSFGTLPVDPSAAELRVESLKGVGKHFKLAPFVIIIVA